jgi:hypothetical protein
LTDYRSVKAIDGDACLAVVSMEAGEANRVFPPSRSQQDSGTGFAMACLRGQVEVLGYI